MENSKGNAMRERKYVIVTDNYDLWKYIFSDLDNIVAFPYDGYKNESIVHLLYKVSHTKHLFGLGKVFLNSWNRLVVEKWHVNEYDVIVFLNSAIWCWFLHEDFIKYLKERKMKLVLLNLDSMNTMRNEFSSKIRSITKYFDLVYTFDYYDAVKYNWHHTCKYYSRMCYNRLTDKKSDALCILYNSGRIRIVTEIYDILRDKGIDCLFAINGVSERELSTYYRDGIIYNRQFTYAEIVSYVQNTNVVIEVLQKDQNGPTLRLFESIVYNKRLLTNNTQIYELDFYSENSMKLFSNSKQIRSIDTSFFKDDILVSSNYNDEFSPKALIAEIDSLI